MIISSLQLTNFRNHKSLLVEFDPQLTLLLGPNGSGKSAVLEALCVLATGASWRAGRSEEMVSFGEEASHAEGEFNDNLVAHQRLHVVLTHGFVQGERVTPVRYLIDGVAKRRADFVGRFKTVLFEPESLEIVIGDPSRRRAFVDQVLSQADSDYVRALLVYGKALRARNRLLTEIRAGRAGQETLEYWERSMAKHGSFIQDKRQQFVQWLTEQFQEDRILNEAHLDIELRYDSSPISLARLSEYREREVAAGFTLVGPQRDDVEIKLKQSHDDSSIPLAAFGSRGKQRMVVLALKLLEADWIEVQTGQKPIVLLDDIFSELDQTSERMVGTLVKGRQAIATTTEVHEGHYPSGTVIDL